ncbi:MAG TPA: DUF4157 domain-containing protein, partial [Acidimicrobiales bacterium]|nr:DUF4157 domain-containing protein [Acidimicrobiales bacterium]
MATSHTGTTAAAGAAAKDTGVDRSPATGTLQISTRETDRGPRPSTVHAGSAVLAGTGVPPAGAEPGPCPAVRMLTRRHDGDEVAADRMARALLAGAVVGAQARPSATPVPADLAPADFGPADFAPADSAPTRFPTCNRQRPPDDWLPAHVVAARNDAPCAVPPELRASAEALTGTDLSSVHLHRGPSASASAHALGARAYTIGSDIVLGDGWSPSTPHGMALVAHELGHVLLAPTGALIGRDEPAEAPPGSAADDIEAPPPGTFKLHDMGADPAEALRTVPEIMTLLRGVHFDRTATANAVPEKVLHPTSAVVYTENYYVVCRPDGKVIDVVAQDPKKRIMVNLRGAVLREHATGIVWFVGERDGVFAIQSFQSIHGIADTTAVRGDSSLYIYLHGVSLPGDLVASLRRRASGSWGGAAEIASWARAQLQQAQRRRSGSGGGAGQHGEGPGAGEKGTGAGGGGTGDNAGAPSNASPSKAGSGEGSAGVAAGGGGASNDKGTSLPLKGDIQLSLAVAPDGSQQLVVSLDRAVTSLALHKGDSPESVDERIDAAVDAMQKARDPETATNIARGAKDTAFSTGASSPGHVDTAQAQEQAKSTATGLTPGERLPGAKGGANALPYPSKLLMDGQPELGPAQTVRGATNRFTMELDYKAMSLGLQDEVWNRLQDIQYYWELIDVTGLAEKMAKQKAATTAVGAGEHAPSGQYEDLARETRNIAEDQSADIEMMSGQNWPWEARAAYLGVIGLSNSVRLLGSVVSGFVDLLTKPLDEESIGFEREGDFLVRCVATPQSTAEQRADPEHHVIRASSVAVMAVRVTSLNKRAAEAVGSEPAKLAADEAALREAEKSGDQRRVEESRATLEADRKASHLSGHELFARTVDAARRAVGTGEKLKNDIAAGNTQAEWSEEEIDLQVALLLRRQSLDTYIQLARAQLEQLTGKGGSHKDWVDEQFAKFQPVGGHSDFRPRVALASEENGRVIELQVMLGELAGSAEGHRRWALVDLSTPGSRDVYVGTSKLPGFEGQQAAVRDCFRSLAEASPYGRGVLAIRLPPELSDALGHAVQVEPAMRSAKGAGERALQRLKDLALVAELAGTVATGGLGLAIGAIGGVAGAVGSVDSLMRRSRTGHMMEAGTIFDV